MKIFGGACSYIYIFTQVIYPVGWEGEGKRPFNQRRDQVFCGTEFSSETKVGEGTSISLCSVCPTTMVPSIKKVSHG